MNWRAFAAHRLFHLFVAFPSILVRDDVKSLSNERVTPKFTPTALYQKMLLVLTGEKNYS